MADNVRIQSRKIFVLFSVCGYVYSPTHICYPARICSINELQPFAIMVGGHVALYQSWPHVLITKLVQPSHNDVIPTVKEISEIFWLTISALTYDLHQLIHNFKSHAPSLMFVWRIAEPVSSFFNHRLIVAWQIALSGKCGSYLGKCKWCWIILFFKKVINEAYWANMHFYWLLERHLNIQTCTSLH